MEENIFYREAKQQNKEISYPSGEQKIMSRLTKEQYKSLTFNHQCGIGLKEVDLD